MFDVVKVKDECVQWIRDFFEKNGPGCNAVLGISGGKDSSVVAAFCVRKRSLLIKLLLSAFSLVIQANGASSGLIVSSIS